MNGRGNRYKERDVSADYDSLFNWPIIAGLEKNVVVWKFLFSWWDFIFFNPVLRLDHWGPSFSEHYQSHSNYWVVLLQQYIPMEFLRPSLQSWNTVALGREDSTSRLHKTSAGWSVSRAAFGACSAFWTLCEINLLSQSRTHRTSFHFSFFLKYLWFLSQSKI